VVQSPDLFGNLRDLSKIHSRIGADRLGRLALTLQCFERLVMRRAIATASTVAVDPSYIDALATSIAVKAATWSGIQK
jgi:hypothetical protein